MSMPWRLTLAVMLILAMLGTLVAHARFNDIRQQEAVLSTGQSVWFYLHLLPGTAVQPGNSPIASGRDQALVLDYGSISSTLGLLNLPVLGLLYQPAEYPDTFRIVNKSTTTVTITVTVAHTSGPGGMTLGELLYVIPASAYSSAANRLTTYTFSILPGNSETLHSVIVTGSLVRNILGLLLFSPFPIGAYSGQIRLDVQYDGQQTTLFVPTSLYVY